MTGNLCHWKLGEGERDDLRVVPFYTETGNKRPFNQPFAAAYDLILCRCERMGYLAPTAERDIKAIFKEKVFGTDVFLVSAETIAYLKWLIYTAVFKDGDQRDKVAGELGHSHFYHTTLQTLEHPSNQHWRVPLRRELEFWYAKYPPAGRRRKSQGGTPVVSAVPVKVYGGLQEFVESDDEAEDPNQAVAAARALAAAASAAAGSGAAAAGAALQS